MKYRGTHPNADTARGFLGVLVPVNFTRASVAALRYARVFQERFGSTVSVLHVIASHPFALGDGACLWMKSDAELNRESLEQLSRLAREELAPEPPAIPLVRRGQPALEILRAIAAEKSDLLKLAVHRRSPLGRWFSGNTATRVVRHAPCPVLVVHSEDDACTETALWRETDIDTDHSRLEPVT